MLTKTQIEAIAERHTLTSGNITWNRIRGFSKDLLLEYDRQQREQMDTLVQCTKTEMKLSDLKHEVAMDTAARAHAQQYLSLTEAMGYHSGDDGMDGPEDYAAGLLAEITNLKEKVATLNAQLVYENPPVDVPHLDLDGIAEKYLESEGRSGLNRDLWQLFKKEVIAAHQKFVVQKATTYALRFRAIMNIIGYTPDNYGKVSPNQYAINLMEENATLKERVKFLEDPTTGSWVNGEEYRKNVRALDVALNGEEGAAKNASMIDIVSQVQTLRARLDHPLLKYIPNGHPQPTTATPPTRRPPFGGPTTCEQLATLHSDEMWKATQPPVNLKEETGLGPLPNPQVGLSLDDIEALAEVGFGTPVPALASMKLSLEDLGVLADTARRNGTLEVFPEVALQWCRAANNEVMALREELKAATMKDAIPIDMILYCPSCGVQHVDAPDEVPGQPILKSAPTSDHPHKMVQVGTYTAQGEWTNPAHKSHKCAHCDCIWRPADVATNGVEILQTNGKNDTWFADLRTPANVDKRDPRGNQVFDMKYWVRAGSTEKKEEAAESAAVQDHLGKQMWDLYASGNPCDNPHCHYHGTPHVHVDCTTSSTPSVPTASTQGSQNNLDQWVPYEEEAPGFREWWESEVPGIRPPVYDAYKVAKRSWDAAVARMHTSQVLTEEQLNTGLKLHHLTHDKPSQLSDGFRAGARWAHSLKPGTSPVAIPYEGDVEELYAGLHSISKCFESSGVVYEKEDMEEGETSYYGTILAAMNFVSAYRKDDEEEEEEEEPASSTLHESAHDWDGWVSKLPAGATVYLAPVGSIKTPVMHDVLEESHRLRDLLTVNAEQYPTDMGELAMAGSCYSMADEDEAPSQIWPWHWKLWDPKDEYSNRLTAAAFLLLEAERVSSIPGNDPV